MSESVISTSNSTSTPLLSGETYTGVAILDDHNDVMVSVKTDQNGTLYMEHSVDGTNWDSSLVFNVTAGINEIHKLVKGARYYRTRLTNSGSDQSYLRLVTTFGTFGHLTAPRNLSVSNDADTAVVRSTDFKLDQAQGRYTGESLRRKFGYNGGIDTTAEVVNGLSSTSYGGFLTSATTVRIKAGGSANDTAAGSGAQSVVVQGLDENFEEASETIATNGASASSATTTTFIRVLRAYVSAVGTYHGANADDITIEASGGSNDLLLIESGQGQTESAVDTIPAGKTAYITNLNVDVEGTKQASVFLYQVQAVDDTSTPYSSRRLIKRLTGLTGHTEHNFTQYIEIPEKSDVWVEAVGPSGGTAVAVAFEMVWVDN